MQLKMGQLHQGKQVGIGTYLLSHCLIICMGNKIYETWTNKRATLLEINQNVTITFANYMRLIVICNTLGVFAIIN